MVLGTDRPGTMSSVVGQAHRTRCFLRWCFLSGSVQVSGEGLNKPEVGWFAGCLKIFEESSSG